MRRYWGLLTLLCLSIHSSSALMALDLEEATGLYIPSESSIDTRTDISEAPFIRLRDYAVLESRSITGQNATHSFPDFEFGINAISSDYHSLSGFLDSTYRYTHSDHTHLGKINQIGLRYQVNPHWVIAWGKERNKRSPGILVSPSDFIFSQTPLPGQREDRTGTWLIRSSYQQIQHSIDMFILPINQGTVIRGLATINGIDCSAEIGIFGSTTKWGTLLEGYVHPLLKTYYDGAIETTPSRATHLIGLSFEPDLFSIRVEYLNTSATTATIPFLSGSEFALLALSIPDYAHYFNIFGTAIVPFNTSQFMVFSRLEWIIHSQWVAGIYGATIRSANNTGHIHSLGTDITVHF